MTAGDNLWREGRRLLSWLGQRRPRAVLAWGLVMLSIGYMVHAARVRWQTPERRDGFAGHTTIDFASSYVMGRMLLCGQGPFLYERQHLWQVLLAAYPRADEAPAAPQEPGDAARLMSWFMGEDNPAAVHFYTSCVLPLAAADGLAAALLTASGLEQAWTPAQLQQATRRCPGGPLYPPINALFAALWGGFPPRTAYYLRQYLDLLLLGLSGLGIRCLSQGRIWASVAILILLFYPGYFGNLYLAQTGLLALTILIWGWACLARGWPTWGGAVWGLLAFKPVWAAAFFPILLLTRRWRACAGMLGMAGGLFLATLPWVGWQAWQDWWTVGREAAFWYNVDENWIHLSRDLLGVPRRYLLDFSQSSKERDCIAAAGWGWGLWATVLGLTATLALSRAAEARHTTQGPRAAFLLLGGWLCCFHFMYYDVLLSYLPVMLLFLPARPYWRPRCWRRQLLIWEERAVCQRLGPGGAAVSGVAPRPAGPLRFQRRLVWELPTASPYGWLRNPFPPLVLLLLLFLETPLRGLCSEESASNLLFWPLETYALLALWSWCGLMWLWRRPVAYGRPLARGVPSESQPESSAGPAMLTPPDPAVPPS